MTHRPLVSVLMNCFNGETYLRQAIDSVIAQTYENWEIIFWDNQSTDGSAEIVRGYDRDPRIKYFHAPTHTPLYEARNYAFEKSTGDFIAFLDVDDWWAPTKLAAQVPLFDDSAVGFVAGNYWMENELKGSRRRAHSEPVPTGWVLDDLLGSYYIGLLTLVVRRSAVTELEYVCDPRYSIIGDFDLVVRLATRWKLAYVQQSVAHYRLHDGNLQRTRRARHVEELETWLGGPGSSAPVCSSPGLDGLRAEVGYMKALNRVIDGDRWGAFRLSRRLPIGRFRARLWAAMLLPEIVVRWLKN